MQTYVLGFAFSPDKNEVLLIKKLKPEWQKGRFNGIGGKVELEETSYTAMVREFQEETGITITEEAWRHFCTMQGDGWMVMCYTTTARIHTAQTMEEEEVSIHGIDEIIHMNTISNVPWLIHLALDTSKIEPPFIIYKS